MLLTSLTSDGNTVEDVLVALAKRQISIGAMVSDVETETSDGGGVVVRGGLNEASPYVANSDDVYLVETDPPGTPLFSNQQSRPFLFSTGTLVYESRSDLFEVADDVTGSIIVADSGYEFDYSLETSIVVALTVRDAGSGREDVVEVDVSLIDVNNNAPKFEQNVYSANVLEGSDVATHVLTIGATDDGSSKGVSR